MMVALLGRAVPMPADGATAVPHADAAAVLRPAKPRVVRFLTFDSGLWAYRACACAVLCTAYSVPDSWCVRCGSAGSQAGRGNVMQMAAAAVLGLVGVAEVRRHVSSVVLWC